MQNKEGLVLSETRFIAMKKWASLGRSGYFANGAKHFIWCPEYFTWYSGFHHEVLCTLIRHQCLVDVVKINNSKTHAYADIDK